MNVTMYIQKSQYVARREGFTVVELLVALLVTSIVFGAMGTLTYAVGRAIDSTEDMNRSQRSLRYATLRISEYIRHGKAAISIPTEGIAVWTSDDNEDGLINGSELVYIEAVAVSEAQQLQIMEFPGQVQSVTIGEITGGGARSTLVGLGNERVTILVDNCSNAVFSHISPTSKFVNLTFAMTEDGVTTNYRVSSRTNASADNLIDQTGELVSGDDD